MSDVLRSPLLFWGRLLHHSHVINVRGKSWRLKEMEETLQFTTGLEKMAIRDHLRLLLHLRKAFL